MPSRWTLILLLSGLTLYAQNATLDLYRELQRNEPAAVAEVQQLAVKVDRLEMTLTGRLYAGPPVAGKLRSAVFIGEGTAHIEPPPAVFEREVLRRLLKVDKVDTTFRTAVFRFSGAPWDGAVFKQAESAAMAQAAGLAKALSERLPRETGLNLDARVLRSLTGDLPGLFFFAQFDGGPLKRFSFLFDAAGRTLADAFGINAGEKGLVFSHVEPDLGNDIWLAFRAEDEYQRGVRPAEPDDFEVRQYQIQIDARQVTRRKLSVKSEMQLVLQRDARSLSFQLNDGLPERRKLRQRRFLALRAASVNGQAAVFVQEPWEIGFTILLPAVAAKAQPLKVVVETEGEPILKIDEDQDLYGLAIGEQESSVSSYYREDLFYPVNTTSWYPRHGYLQRSLYSVEVWHPSRYRAIAPGAKVKEEKLATHTVTTWDTPYPAMISTFAIGLFESSSAALVGRPGRATYYFKGGNLAKDKQTYMLTELSNGVQFFSEIFGDYPYGDIQAVMHPRGYGQSFPGLLLLPPTGQRTNMFEFSFLAHEAAHQWWGHVVPWRTYRDQWLSEGFAEYSGVIYAGVRMNADAGLKLVRSMRRSLTAPPATTTGVGAGRVAELGPIILGLRSATTATADAYQQLVYYKGALVLRMLHFLFRDPATGKDTGFYDMLKDFVKRQNGPASTESFSAVANEHFLRSAIGRKYNFRDIGWFFRQWVSESRLPQYSLKYTVESQPDGKLVLKGMLTQQDAGDGWVMPLPLLIKFGKDKVARGTVLANGPQTPVSIPLPEKPTEVLLDPDMWVLSSSTTIDK